MNSVDPKLTALQFNEYINRQDVDGLSGLMTEGHTFVDRKGEVDRGKATMTQRWTDFFKSFPDYRNTFQRANPRGNGLSCTGMPPGRRERIQITRYGQP